jgi:hypothetical protein
VKAAVAQFLHPVTGGADGGGWQPGRNLYASDMAAVLERVPGLDHVEVLELLVGGVPQDDRVQVPAGQILAAGQISLRSAAAAPGAGEGTT